MPRGRYQQQQWEQREADILATLATLVQARGFASVTMDELADAVGISKATLYQHFASKDALLAALMTHHAGRFLAWLEATADQPPLARLQATLRLLVDAHFVSAPGADDLPGQPLLWIGRDEVLPVFAHSPALLALHADILARLEAIVREGQALGAIAADLTPAVVVSALWALSTIPATAGSSTPGHALASAAPPAAALIAQVQALFARAIAPPPPA